MTHVVRDSRVALAQIRPRLGDIEHNLSIHLEYADRAAAAGCDVVAFPEQSLTGYFLSDLVVDVAVSRSDALLKPILEASHQVAIVFGFIERTPDHRCVAAAGYAANGRLLHVHHKVYLATYGLFDEARDLAPGRHLRAFDTPHGRQAMLICEDLWHPSSASLVAADGADIIYGLSSSPGRGVGNGSHELGSTETWHALNRMYAQMLVCYVVHVNRVGFEDGVNFWGGSEVIAPDGTCLVRGPEFDEALVIADMPDSGLRRQRARLPLRRDENVDLVSREFARVLVERSDATDDE